MHPNPVFHTAGTAQNLAFARERGFGQLTVCGDDGPLAAHVPFVLTDEGDSLELHLMRSNPVARALKAPKPALMAVTGPDGYVSPDWYGVQDQVPTWNYIAVHLRGTIDLLPDTELRGVLDRLSDTMENRIPKTPWRSSKMSPGVMDRMMRSLVACRMSIDAVDGTWKLSQNKPESARSGAADGIEAAWAPGQEVRKLAGLMRGVKKA